MERRRIPKVERHIVSEQARTYFDFLIPPGVLPEDAHVFLVAHLGVDITRTLEGGSWDGDSKHDAK